MTNKCKKCGSEVNIEKHHIHCKFMNNKRGYGKTIYLCRDKCHIPLHLIISSILWENIRKEDEFKVIGEIEKFTEKYIDSTINSTIIQKVLNNDVKDNSTCPECGRTDLDIEDFLITKKCPYCDYILLNPEFDN
jgi:hypothetical protein